EGAEQPRFREVIDPIIAPSTASDHARGGISTPDRLAASTPRPEADAGRADGSDGPAAGPVTGQLRSVQSWGSNARRLREEGGRRPPRQLVLGSRRMHAGPYR